MNFIKDFKNVFQQPLRLILIAVSGAFLFYFNFSSGNFWWVMSNILPLILIIGSAIILQLKEKTLAAHGVLFFSGYINSFSAFFRNLLSYNFTAKSMVKFGPLVGSFVFMVIGIYLLLMLLSYFLSKDYEIENKRSSVWISALIAFIYFYVGFGFNTAFFKLISPIIALMFGYEFFAVVLLLAGVIDIPFDIIDAIYSKFIKFYNISTFVLWALGFYFIVTAILALVKMGKNPFGAPLTEDEETVQQITHEKSEDSEDSEEI